VGDPLRDRRALRRSVRFRLAFSGARPAPGPCFLGRGSGGRYPASACPSPGRSAQSGRGAARPGPGAARERGNDPRPQAPPSPALKAFPLGAPLVERIQ